MRKLLLATLLSSSPIVANVVQESYNNASLSPYNQYDVCQPCCCDRGYYGAYDGCYSCGRTACIYELNDDSFEDDAGYPGKKDGELIDYFSR